MVPSTLEQSQVLWDMLQDDHKCRGVSMERVWSGLRTKEVYACLFKDPKRVMHGPLCKEASQIRWEIPDS